MLNSPRKTLNETRVDPAFDRRSWTEEEVADYAAGHRAGTARKPIEQDCSSAWRIGWADAQE